jgi:hypothetical protein
MAFSFGECPCRGGAYRTLYVKVNASVQGRQVAMDDVAQGVCDACGSRVYKADTLRRIEAVMRGETSDPVAMGS